MNGELENNLKINDMNLTTENLQEWKAELNRISKPHFGDNFADCVSDQDYLTDNLGDTPEDVLNENLKADY